MSAAVDRPPRRRGRGRGSRVSNSEALLLLIPALLPIVVLSALPLARGIYLGFTDSQAGLGLTTHFIGLENFRKLLHDHLFLESFKIGLIWAFAVTAIQFVLALGLALLLSSKLRLRGLARSLALVPWAMPPVIVAIMWNLVYQPQAGLLNEVLYRVHGPMQGTDWLSSFTYAFPAVILVGVWAGMPQTTITLLAGLQTIPDELHEAASTDGAGMFRRFRHITLPHMRGVIVAITSLDLVWNFNSFGLIYILTQGGPGGKTQVPAVFAYDAAFKYGQFGYGAALGDFMVVVIAVILSVYLWGRFREST
jgi:multiple sugar transport system permease protein